MKKDILKFDKPEQFPKDEILNEDDRLVRAWMSVEVRDKQGDIVPIPEFKRVMNTWFKRGATVMDQHTNRPIGRGLHWEVSKHPESKQQGIMLDYQVFDDYSVDHQVWNDIKEGKRKGLSIGGRALGEPEMKSDKYSGKQGKMLKDIELYEVSSVENPANQFGENVAVNFLAKGMPTTDEQKLMKDLQKGYSGEISKPFAGFQDFDQCCIAQKEKGHSDDACKRICGWLKNKTESNNEDIEEVKANDTELQESPEMTESEAPEQPIMDNQIKPDERPDKTEFVQEMADLIAEAVKQRLKNEQAEFAESSNQITAEGLEEEMEPEQPMEESEETGPGGHIPDGTGPHGGGYGPGEGRADGSGMGEETIPGGMAEGKDESQFDQEALQQGIEIEMEHTDDENIAREIAMDHLTEDPEYYTKLSEMEGNTEKAFLKALLQPKERAKQREEVAAWLKDNPNPKDEELHAWAESKGYDIDEVEGDMYRLATNQVKKEWPADFVKACKKPIKKGKVYLKPGEQPPKGASVQQGARGGKYYEESGAGAKPKEKTPQSKPGYPKAGGDPNYLINDPKYQRAQERHQREQTTNKPKELIEAFHNSQQKLKDLATKRAQEMGLDPKQAIGKTPQDHYYFLIGSEQQGAKPSGHINEAGDAPEGFKGNIQNPPKNIQDYFFENSGKKPTEKEDVPEIDMENAPGGFKSWVDSLPKKESKSEVWWDDTKNKFGVEFKEGEAQWQKVNTPSGTYLVDTEGYGYARYAAKLKSNKTPIQKARIYLKPGQQAPQGASVQQGKHGGKFYEDRPQQGIKPGTSSFDKPGTTPAEMGQRRSRNEVSSKKPSEIDQIINNLEGQGQIPKGSRDTFQSMNPQQKELFLNLLEGQGKVPAGTRDKNKPQGSAQQPGAKKIGDNITMEGGYHHGKQGKITNIYANSKDEPMSFDVEVEGKKINIGADDPSLKSQGQQNKPQGNQDIQSRIDELPKLINEVDNSDMQGITEAISAKIMGGYPKTREERDKHRQISDSMMAFANGELTRDELQFELNDVKSNSNKSSEHTVTRKGEWPGDLLKAVLKPKDINTQ